MKKLRLLLGVFILMAVAAGCSNDNEWNDRGETIDMGDDMLLTLDMRVPDIRSGAATYALTEADENEMKEVDLLVFREIDGIEYYLYHTHATSIDNNNGGINKKFKALIQKSRGSERHRIVVIANAREAVGEVVESFNTDMTKEEVLSQVTFDTDRIWNTTSSDYFDALPMWGETSNTHIITGETNHETLGTIQMLRSVARIDVGLEIDEDELQNLATRFKIEEVKIHNANSRSRVAPVASHLENNRATRPSLAANTQAVTPSIGYSHTPADLSFIREIYVGEADIRNQSDDDNMFCIVIGGYYTKEGEQENTDRKTWYRVDFYTTDENDMQERLDILRNHRYKVDIVSVEGPGYETEEIAVNSRPVNMTATIIAWDEAMGDYTFDGQYQLVVDKSRITLYEEGINAKELKIFVDHPDGWSIDYEGNTWIHVDQETGSAGNTITVRVTADAYSGQENPRNDYFVIKAGKLRKKIYVTQLNEAELSIEISPSELTFRKSPSQPKSIRVTVFPADAQVVFERVDTRYPITEWETYPSTSVSGQSRIYHFQPKENEMGRDLASAFSVTVYDESGQRRGASKLLTIKQIYQDLTFFAEPDRWYPAIGGQRTVAVTSDAPWHVDHVTGDNIFASYPTGTQPESQGDESIDFPFTLSDNNTFATREGIMHVASDDPDFPSRRTITIKQTFVDAMLNINDGYTIVDFSTESTEKDAKFKVNSKWKFTATAGVYNETIEKIYETNDDDAGQRVAGTTYEGGMPLRESGRTLRIVPKAFPKAEGTPKGGYERTTTLTFTNVFDDSPTSEATAKTKTITVKRIVPLYFDFISVSPKGDNTYTFDAGQQNDAISLKVNTNNLVKAQLFSGTTALGGIMIQSREPYTIGRELKLSVPANESWKERELNVKTWHGVWNAVKYDLDETGKTLRATYKQKPLYHISEKDTDLDNIGSGVKKSPKVRLKGQFPDPIKIRVANASGTALDTNTGQVPASASAIATKEGTVSVPLYEAWSSREVKMQFEHPDTKIWTDVGTKKVQKGYELTKKVRDPGTTTNYKGGTVKITLGGFRPRLSVRVANTTGAGIVNIAGTGTNSHELKEYIAASTTGADGSAVITIPENTGKARKLRAEYWNPIKDNGPEKEKGGWDLIKATSGDDEWWQEECPYIVSPVYNGSYTYLISKKEVQENKYTYMELTAEKSDPTSACNKIMGGTNWYIPHPTQSSQVPGLDAEKMAFMNKNIYWCGILWKKYNYQSEKYEAYLMQMKDDGSVQTEPSGYSWIQRADKYYIKAHFGPEGVPLRCIKNASDL